MSNYKQRIADALLERKLEGKGAVLIESPKWCGKTTTSEKATFRNRPICMAEDATDGLVRIG